LLPDAGSYSYICYMIFSIQKPTFSLLLACLLLSSGSYAQKTKTKKKAQPAVVTPPAPAAAAAAPGSVPNKPRPYNELSKSAEQFANTISAKELEEHLRIIASDEYEGRETGEPGQKKAANYLAEQFRKMGLTSPKEIGEEYFQHFTLEKKSWGKVNLKVGKQDYTLLKDFYPMGGSLDALTPLQLVFAGYGIEDEKYHDYANLDVKGKAVVLLQGEPKDSKGNYVISGTDKMSTWTADRGEKIRVAAEKGALAVFVIPASADEFAKSLKRAEHRVKQSSLGQTDEKATTQPPMIYVSPALGYQLLGASEAKLELFKKGLMASGKPLTSPFKPATDVKLQAERVREKVETENVLGYLPGTDLAKEVLVITAHYDHIGVQEGKVFNGADDDGSGTVTLLELAQAFAQARDAGFGPRRSILFMPVTGEEKGLLGSEYYVQHPVFPLEQTVADLNIDMIGRTDEAHKDQKDYVYLIGADKLSSQLHELSEMANREHTQLKLDYTFNDENDPNQFYYRSDHYNFAKKGIPVIFYFCGVHEDYHMETDEVGKIMFPKMEPIAKLVFYTAWEIANRDERLKVDKEVKE
jgi:hypothetical protein